MLAATKHSDVICLYLRNSISQLDFSLQRETSLFTETITSLIKSENDIKSGIDSLLPRIFNLRIKALKWFSRQNLNLIELHDEVYSDFDKFSANPQYKTLGESIKVALRKNQFVIDILVKEGKFQLSGPSESISQLPEVTYQQFFAAVTFNAPDESAQKFVDWVNASMYIELICFCAMVIYDEHLPVTDYQLTEMSGLISKAGENYLKLFLDSGLFKNRSYEIDLESDDDAKLLKGMQYLMSTGSTFDFLNDEEELYTVADLKKVYNA